MTRLTIEHNLERHELVESLASLAIAELIGDQLSKAIRSAEHNREPVREHYLLEIMVQFADAGRRLDNLMVSNVNRAIAGMLREPDELHKGSVSTWLRRRRPGRLLLTQANIDELASLIRQHYRIAIRAGAAPDWGIDDNLGRRWANLGITRPGISFSGLVGDAFTAGRMAQILEDGTSLEDMRRMAAEFPISRAASLTMQATADRVGFDLVGGPGYRAEIDAGRLVLDQNARRVQDIALMYQAGTLRHTPTNRTGLSPEEMEALGTDRAVESWQGLARELRNRMATIDRSRDWERVAASSTRMAANIGNIQAMAESGVAELYFDVHRDACAHCKNMYLLDDGSPRYFPIGEIMENIATTGGANYGRLVSKIGDKERGWLPTGLLHPWCQCRPMRRIAGATRLPGRSK